jgi:hypothetical protein
MKQIRLVVAAATALALIGLPAQPMQAGEPKELPKQVQQAKAQVEDYLQKIDGLKQSPTVKWLGDPAVQEIFPNLTFFAVRYRKFPIAVAPPGKLSSANVFVVGDKEKLRVLSTPDDFPKFFSTEFQANKIKVTEKSAAVCLRAWLKISEELLQDGFYTFEIVKTDVQKKGANQFEGKGQSMVAKGGNGKIEVTMKFDAEGNLSAGQDYKLQPGPRPKCQATKLLDPDPIVRYMAESELLFMGVAARSYLVEQRSRARDPNLRQAIDRMLNRIESIGW